MADFSGFNWGNWGGLNTATTPTTPTTATPTGGLSTITPVASSVQPTTTGLPTTGASVPSTPINPEIANAYQNLFGRTADTSGAQYWAGTGLTGDALKNAMIAGAQGTDLSHYQAAQDYQSLFGRQADQPGLAYWTQSGLTGDALKNAMVAGAQGTDITAAPLMQSINTTNQNVLGTDYVAPTGYNTYQTDLQNKVLSGQMTADQYNTELQNSTYNKTQEANRMAGILSSVYGMDQNTAIQNARDLYQGKSTDSTLTKYYNEMLTDPAKAQHDILTEKANAADAATNPYFQKNPDMLSVYKDIGNTVEFQNAGAGGQYGYYQGIPIIKKSEIDNVFNKLGSDYITGNAPDKLDNAMGWDTGSLSALEARGASALGIKKQAGSTDENGNVTADTYSGDMNAVAKQLGLNPAKYDSQDKLYNAINDAAKDFYYVAGKTGVGAGGIGEVKNGVKQTAAVTNPAAAGFNHAGVLYKAQGDKLVPIPQTLKGYNSGMELSPGSWLSNTLGDFAVPLAIGSMFVAPGLAGALGGGLGGAAGAGAILGGGMAGVTGGDVLKGAALGGLGGGLSTQIPTIGSSIAPGFDPAIQNIIGRGAINLGMGLASGQPLSNVAANTALSTGTNLGLNVAGVPNNALTNAAINAGTQYALTGNVNPISLANSAIRYGMSTAKQNPVKEGGLISMKKGGKVQHFDDGGGVDGGFDVANIDFGNAPTPSFDINAYNWNDLANQDFSSAFNVPDFTQATQYLQGLDVGNNSWGTTPQDFITTSMDSANGTSTQITDPITGRVIGGTDDTGRSFIVDENGKTVYSDTGESVAGTPTTNFGGNLADPNDVQKLLDYNAAIANGGYPVTNADGTTSVINPNTGKIMWTSGLPGITTPKVTTPSTTTPATTAARQATTGTTAPSQGGIANLAPGLTKANLNWDLEGLPIHRATGGSSSTSSSGLDYASSLGDSNATYNPFATSSVTQKKPTFTSRSALGALVGMPSYMRYANGGDVQHTPEFYSEGGLGTMNNRYVKGRGDGTSDSVPAMLANGEFVIPADVVSGLGNGSNDSGAKILDEFLKVIRRDKRSASPDKLPADSKGPQAYLLQAKRKVRK